MDLGTKIAVVDIETTGFLNQGGLIVEVGIAELDMISGDIRVVYNQVVRENAFTVKHTKHPFGWIFQNSNLRPEMVMAAPTLDETRPGIQEVLNSYPLGATAFNKGFDFPFLKSRGIMVKEQACIMLSATPVVNLPSKNGYSNPKWPNMQEAWDFFFKNSGYHECHRAADDAIHEAKILFELLRRGAFKVVRPK